MINNLIKFFLLRNTLFLKIILVFTLPALGMLYFSTVLVYDKIKTFSEVDNIQRNVEYITISQNLIHSLQKERGYSSIYLDSKKFKEELFIQRNITDQEYKQYLKKANQLNEGNHLSIDIKKLQSKFYTIEAFREEIDEAKITSVQVMQKYTKINTFLLESI